MFMCGHLPPQFMSGNDPVCDGNFINQPCHGYPPIEYPYIRVAGLPEERLAAKQMILSVMDSKSSRVTLKMDVSFGDHSHIIGKGGNTIKKVMRDTQCHIHFPDSNRTSSEKSNQVSIAGPPFNVESARRQIRELLPIVLKFEIPTTSTIPDTSSPIITNIAQTHNVTISFQPQPRSYGCYGCVKGLHSDPFGVRDAILKIFEHLTGTVPVTVPVTTQLEIDPKHHIFIRGHNGNNINNIQQATNARIQLPDPNDTSCRKSTITIQGSIESTVTAKVYLLQNLPLILMFDIRDGEHDHVLEQGILNKLMDLNDVQITVKPKLKQCCKAIIVKGHELKAPNIYKTRLHLIGEDASNMPYICAPLPTLMMPPTNPALPHVNAPLHMLNGIIPPPPPLPVAISTSYTCHSSPLTSPPMQSSSPLIQHNVDVPKPSGRSPPHVNGNVTFISVVPAGQRIIGSEIKSKRLSVDGIFGVIKNEQPSSTTWSAEEVKKTPAKHVSTNSIDSGLSQSQEDLDSSSLSLTTHLINKLTLQRNTNFGPGEYERYRKHAENAMHSEISISKARTPTDAWVGMGFSNSMPGVVLKEVKSCSSGASDSSVSSSPSSSSSCLAVSSVQSCSQTNTSSPSAMITTTNNNNISMRRPPPGLEDSQPHLDNTLFLNSNFDYGSLLNSPKLPMSSAYRSIKSISGLFQLLGVEQYTDAFEKEEVDLLTFVSLTDEDLKELGVVTFGARKKMMNAMKELQIIHGQAPASLSNNMHLSPLSLVPSTFSSTFCGNVRHSQNDDDIAAHSIRW